MPTDEGGADVGDRAAPSRRRVGASRERVVRATRPVGRACDDKFRASRSGRPCNSSCDADESPLHACVPALRAVGRSCGPCAAPCDRCALTTRCRRVVVSDRLGGVWSRSSVVRSRTGVVSARRASVLARRASVLARRASVWRRPSAARCRRGVVAGCRTTGCGLSGRRAMRRCQRVIARSLRVAVRGRRVATGADAELGRAGGEVGGGGEGSSTPRAGWRAVRAEPYLEAVCSRLGTEVARRSSVASLYIYGC